MPGPAFTGVDASRVLNRSLAYSSVLVSTTALTLSGTQNSDACPVAGPQNFAVQVTWTATPLGVLQLQASNDGTNWENLGASWYFGGAANTHIFNVLGRAYAFIRLQTVLTSGSGTISVALVYGEVI